MKMTQLKRVFFWLSGAGTETLDLCPNWEQRKYVAFGCTVLVPCAFAFIACSYALSTLTNQAWVVAGVAGVWALIILTIDRALLACYRPLMAPIRKVGQFSLRFVVALLMGVTIAHPLVLLLFRDTITSEIEADRTVLIEQTKGKFFDSKQQIRDQIARLERGIADQRNKWNESYQAKFIIQETKNINSAIPGLSDAQQKELQSATVEATKPFRDRLAAIETQATELTPQYTKLQTELGYWQAEFERELNGQRSGLSGEGPRARSIRSDQLEPRRVESKRLAGLLEHLTAEKKALETQIRSAESSAISTFETKRKELEQANQAEADRVATLKRKVETEQVDTFTSQQNDLRQTIKKQIDANLEELARTQNELAAMVADETKRIDAISAEPRKDILTQTLALHKLFNAENQGGTFAFYTYIILTALFMLVDTIPLIIKFFTKSGPYDYLVDQDEVRFKGDHRAFLNRHQRYMAQMTGSHLVALTGDPHLEAALISGVERSRATREFLHAVTEDIAAFEAESAQHQLTGSPENNAMFAQMKTNFYQEIQKRLESFFKA